MDDDMNLFINVNTELIDGTMIGNRLLIFLAPSGEWLCLCPCLVFDQLVSTRPGWDNYNSLM